MKRTSIVLFVVAAALLAFILVFERGTVSTGEREQRRGRVLEEFVPKRVTRIELQRRGVTTVITRGPDEENDLELGAWQVEQPFVAKADQDVVNSLIAELEWVEARRTLRDVSSEDATLFGFDKPRHRLWYTVGRERRLLVVGKETPQSDGTYVQAGDPKTAYIVGKDLIEALDREPAHFHTKELHDGVSTFGARKLTWQDTEGKRSVEKRDDFFWLVEPAGGFASEPAVSAAVEGLDTLRATRYVAAANAAPAPYGLDAPTYTLSVESRSYDAKLKEKFKTVTLTLRVGKACAEQRGESYLRIDEGPILCASDADIAKTKQSASTLEEKRLLVLSDAQIQGVRIRDGKAELVLEESENEWKYSLRVSGKETASGNADGAAVSEWWKVLRAAQAESVIPPNAAPLRDDAVVTVRFDRGKDKPAHELGFGRHEGGRVAVTRSGEGALLWFPEAVTELVTTSAVRFRPTKLLSQDASAWRELRVVRSSGATETVTRQADGGYRFTAPVAAEVERVVVDEILRLFSSLEALRFVADGPSPIHGLSSPELTLQVEYTSDAGKAEAGSSKHLLRLGAKTDGGRFAQLDADPAVFIVPQVLVAVLEQPLASRMPDSGFTPRREDVDLPLEAVTEP